MKIFVFSRPVSDYGASTERLQPALADADGAKAAKRLMVAPAYKDGVNVNVIEQIRDLQSTTTG